MAIFERYRSKIIEDDQHAIRGEKNVSLQRFGIERARTFQLYKILALRAVVSEDADREGQHNPDNTWPRRPNLSEETRDTRAYNHEGVGRSDTAGGTPR